MSRHLNEYRVESASYALVRRIVPILSHDLAGALQPLQMMSLVLERRLQNPNLDHEALVKSGSQVKNQAKEASKACMDLMGWLTPNCSEKVSVCAGLAQTTKLLASSLSLRGFTLVNKDSDLHVELPCAVMRSVYLAALFAITDNAVAPADVLLEAHAVGSQVVLGISIKSSTNEYLASDPLPYRKVEWDDVEALAMDHGVRLATTDDYVELTIS